MSADELLRVPPRTTWWRDAVIYQVYIRSFADANGDGIGDIAGLRSRLPYLRSLGVDALWLNPWYPSPMADGGYDIADYRRIDPAFGTLDEAIAFIEAAHEQNLRIITDLVPNHCSSKHPWFEAALAAHPSSPQRARFWFRPGRGPRGAQPPNDWPSYFGGSAWTQVQERDGSPGEWYLHLFAPEQPDFNWSHAEVREEFADIFRFWMALGVDGFRIDVAHAMVKDPALPDVGPDPVAGRLPYQDQPGVHDVLRQWRALVDAAPGEHALVGEVWLPAPQQPIDYVRPDELHSVFNFDYLCCPWDAARLRAVVDDTIAAHATTGAPPTWVLSNHDVTRHVTRYGRAETSHDPADRRHGWPFDLELGLRRARAAALLTLALPGAAYVYQGEELGLAEHEDIPDALRQDPVLRRSGGTDRGRDGCRVPLPWSGQKPPFGFSPAAAYADPWLPQPTEWRDQSVQAQDVDAQSMLALYRAALRLRKSVVKGAGDLQWLELAAGMLGFQRGRSFACVVNISGGPEPLPAHADILLASEPIMQAVLPRDCAAWLLVGDPEAG